MISNNSFYRLPKELDLLIKILNKGKNEKISLVEKENFVEIDWEYFLKLAFHHRIYPVVYSILKKNPDNIIPAYVIQNLSQEYKKILLTCYS